MSSINSNKKNKIALIDCNSFYVSCERLFNPKINNKPVVVLSNNDGCVISRSTEAKKIGIKMGEPYFKVKELVKKKEKYFLLSKKNNSTKEIEINTNLNTELWGVVTYVIHKL